ncbi:MAG: NADH-quinone oxidoreductase subunit NuoK [Verrucomicrobia bacterium]|nr:NADH-quinone oxidoreductase subunit NuoK [Verrucomicrobiota bacterium]
MVSLPACLALSGLLFTAGAAGVFLRRSALLGLISVELMLNAANLNFVAFWRHGASADGVDGVMFALFSIALAAGEAAVGLALIIAIYRRHRAVYLDELTELKG